MADYQKMYYLLCDAASKAIDASLEDAKRILRGALLEAEELYICTCDKDSREEKSCSQES